MKNRKKKFRGNHPQFEVRGFLQYSEGTDDKLRLVDVHAMKGQSVGATKRAQAPAKSRRNLIAYKHDDELKQIVNTLKTQKFIEVKNLENPKRYLENMGDRAHRRGIRLAFTRCDDSVFIFLPKEHEPAYYEMQAVRAAA